MGLAEDWEQILNRSAIHQSVNHEGDIDLKTLGFSATTEGFVEKLFSEIDEIQHFLHQLCKVVDELVDRGMTNS